MYTTTAQTAQLLLSDSHFIKFSPITRIGQVHDSFHIKRLSIDLDRVSVHTQLRYRPKLESESESDIVLRRVLFEHITERHKEVPRNPGLGKLPYSSL